MIDDPHDASWIPHEKNVAICPIHREDIETCGCGRNTAPGVVLVTLMMAAVVCLIAGVVLTLMISAR